MRFEPRLIHADDAPTNAAGELQLPDDLQALADQLVDDAARLHASNPPSLPAPSAAISVSPATRQGSNRRSRTALIAAAAIVGIAIVLIPLRDKLLPSAATSPAPTSAASQAQSQILIDSQPLLDIQSLDRFGAATAPEREALLDLSPTDGETVFVSF